MVINVFPPAGKTAWQQQVQRELPDGQSPDSLRRLQADGFVTEPYYTADDLDQVPASAQQLAQQQTPGWLNTPTVNLTDPTTDNPTLRRALTAGADALLIPVTRPTDLSRLLVGIKLSDTPVFFQETEDISLIDSSAFFTALRQVAPYQWRGGFLSGKVEYIAMAMTQTADSPRFRVVCADSRPFHNAGSTAGQELALLLAQLADHYDYLTEQGFSIEQLATKTMVMVPVGTNYFSEIAKLRALRILWQRFVGSYQLSVDKSQNPKPPLFIHAQTSTFYEAAVTPYTNLLRATTEAMSAVIGGCDALTVLPYDQLTHQPGRPASELGDRLARNVSLLLRDESQLGRVADPGAGSYYIESLTHQLTEAAWSIFLQVEEMGGLSKAMANGFVTDLLDKAFTANVATVKQGRVLVGVTQFRHDEVPANVAPTVLAESSLTTVFSTAPLPNRRLAESFEF